MLQSTTAITLRPPSLHHFNSFPPSLPYHLAQPIPQLQLHFRDTFLRLATIIQRPGPAIVSSAAPAKPNVETSVYPALVHSIG